MIFESKAFTMGHSLPVYESSNDAILLPLIANLQAALNDSTAALFQRYRALFGLKHHACNSVDHATSTAAIRAMASAFSTPSSLLKHEIAYCLGQTRNLATVPYLKAVLQNAEEDAMVRHEAAEALGAIGDTGSLELLKGAWKDETEEIVVRETCEIAVARIEWQAGEQAQKERLRQRQVLVMSPDPRLMGALT